MSPFRVFAAACVLGASLACGGDSPAAAAASAATAAFDPSVPAVLFVGNSLTYENDLPARVRTIARAAGLPLETGSVTRGDTSLLDHWQDRSIHNELARRRWTFVVLQQGPSTLPESREELIRAATLLAGEIRSTGGQPVLLMVWPLPGQTQAAVAASYRAAAEATGALLVPAGEAWVAARSAEPAFVFTKEDGYHPTALGTELAALTAVCTLYPGTQAAPQLALPDAQREALRQAGCPTR